MENQDLYINQACTYGYNSGVKSKLSARESQKLLKYVTDTVYTYKDKVNLIIEFLMKNNIQVSPILINLSKEEDEERLKAFVVSFDERSKGGDKMRTIGKNIMELRKKAGLTQMEVVEKAGEIRTEATFNQAQLSNWEQDKTKPSGKNLELLAQILNCSVLDFYKVEGLTEEEYNKKEEEAKEKLKGTSQGKAYDLGFIYGNKYGLEEIKELVHNALTSKEDNKINIIIDYLTQKGEIITKEFSELLINENNYDNFISFVIGLSNGAIDKNKK